MESRIQIFRKLHFSSELWKRPWLHPRPLILRKWKIAPQNPEKMDSSHTNLIWNMLPIFLIFTNIIWNLSEFVLWFIFLMTSIPHNFTRNQKKKLNLIFFNNLWNLLLGLEKTKKVFHLLSASFQRYVIISDTLSVWKTTEEKFLNVRKTKSISLPILSNNTSWYVYI